MPAKIRHQPIDPLADPDTGKRIVFQKIPMRLSYDDIMGQHSTANPMDPASADFGFTPRRRTLPKAADQGDIGRT